MEQNKKQVTIIAGPQAEAIRRALDSEASLSFVDKSVPGLVILEVIVDEEEV